MKPCPRVASLRLACVADLTRRPPGDCSLFPSLQATGQLPHLQRGYYTGREQRDPNSIQPSGRFCWADTVSHLSFPKSSQWGLYLSPPHPSL